MQLLKRTFLRSFNIQIRIIGPIVSDIIIALKVSIEQQRVVCLSVFATYLAGLSLKIVVWNEMYCIRPIDRLHPVHVHVRKFVNLLSFICKSIMSAQRLYNTIIMYMKTEFMHFVYLQTLSDMYSTKCSRAAKTSSTRARISCVQ